MKLLTKEIERTLPALFSQEENEDPTIVLHYFNPSGAGDWWVYEAGAELVDGRTVPIAGVENVRGVRRYHDPGAKELQSSPGENDVRGGLPEQEDREDPGDRASVRAGASEMEGRPDSLVGLCLPPEAGTSPGTEDRVRAEGDSSSGGEAWPATEGQRGGASPESGPTGRPPGEPRSPGLEGAQQGVLPESVEVEDIRFFGLCAIHTPELGYVSLRELEEFRGPFGLGIERDLHWQPKPLSEVETEALRRYRG